MPRRQRRDDQPRGYRLAQGFALVSCLALPVGGYLAGDAVDAFPGFLTIEQAEDTDARSAPAQAETSAADWPTALPDDVVPGDDETVAAPALPDADAMTAALQPLIDSELIGGRVGISVIDISTGEQLVDHDSTRPQVPASTTKLLTAAAAYSTMEPDATLETTAVLKGSDLYLVGHGDMLLTTGESTGKANGTGSLLDLARQVSQEVDGPVTVHVDDSYFSGDAVNAAWGANNPSNGWVAPIMSLGIDDGALDSSEYGAKSSDPAMDAGTAFVTLLQQQGVQLASGGVDRAAAPEDGRDVGTVRSATLEDIIAYTLQRSDNTQASVLGRLVAGATGRERSDAGATEAVSEAVKSLVSDSGVDTSALELHDTCGLSVQNRIPPVVLAELVRAAADGTQPKAARALGQLPIGGLSGTLSGRFEDADAADARGIVRGKTGYLSGATSLAGTVTTPAGRTLSFAIIAYGFDGADGAEAKATVDKMAAVLAAAR